MGNPLTNNLPAAIDQFLMDMAQTVGPFDYGDVIKFADKIADVKTDKNIAIIRKLYKAAKDAAEYDDTDEFNAIGEDLNDIITGVKDFNQPGAIFADTRTFKYEDSQNSEYNDLGTDIRTGEKFPESLNESENGLTDTQKDLIKEIALADFECGHFTTADFFIDDEEGDFTGVEQAAADYYQELVNMGPAGFYEEFADELDFDPDFVAEYGDPEDLPFGSYDPDYPNPYPDEEEDPDEVRDMGEMYGVPRGATPEEALKHFESKKAPNKKGLKEDRSLGRTPKDFKDIGRGTTVLDRDGEPWTVAEKGTVGELNRKYPECEIFEKSYYHAVYVVDPICDYNHEDRGKHIFVYGDYDDGYNNVLAYWDDVPTRSWSVYMRESKKASNRKTLKEDTDLDSLVGKKVKCIKGASHPNMGKLFDKGRTYKVSKSEDGRICVGKVYVGKEFFDSHFEVEDALDENYEDIYSATFQAKGFVNQMRKTYDDDTIKMAVENCLKESIKINEDEDEDEESGFVRDFVDELDADNELTDEIYEQVTKDRNYSDYQLELVDEAIRHFIDDWRHDSGDIEAETAEEAKQIILDSIGDYLEPNLPEEAAKEDDKASIKNWSKKDQETYKAALKLLGKKRELTKSEKRFIKETCYYIYSNLGRQLTDEELELYCEFASGYDMSVLKDEDWTTKEWAESFVKDDLE